MTNRNSKERPSGALNRWITPILFVWLCLGAAMTAQAQTVQWQGGTPTADRVMIALTDDETAALKVDFYVRVATITRAKVQITLPAGTTTTAAGITQLAEHTAGAVSAQLSGQVLTVIFGGTQATPADVAAELRVAFTVPVRTTANAAGCAFESGNVDVKVLSNTTLVANGGQAASVEIDAIKPAFSITPKAAGPTGGTITNGAAIVAGLANPGTGGAGTDKGTFKINLATTSRTAKGLRLTITVDNGTNTKLENFAFNGTPLTLGTTGTDVINAANSATYTINLPNEVFSTTAKELSFDAYSKYSGAHPITVAYQYNPTVNCVSGSIAGVYSLNYEAVVGNAYFAMPSMNLVLPPTSGLPADFLLQPNLGTYEFPLDGTTTFYYKVTYRNTGSAAAQEISFPLTFPYGGATYSYHDQTKNILYSIDGATPVPVSRFTYATKLANNTYRWIKPALLNEYTAATAYIDNDVVLPNQTLVFFFPIKSGLIYDNLQSKFDVVSKNNFVNEFMQSTGSGSIQGKNGNGTAIDATRTSDAQSKHGSLMLFGNVMPAQSLHPSETATNQTNFRSGLLKADLMVPQNIDLNIKIPPFIELIDASGTVTTDITQALTYGTLTPTQNSSTNAGVYKVYTVRYTHPTGNEYNNPLILRYRAIEATNPIAAGYTQNTTDTIEYWVDYNLGASTAAAAAYRPVLPRFAQTFVPVTFAVEEAGLRLLSFNFQRTRKGLIDSNNDRIADSNTPAPDSEIEHNRYWGYDTGNMIVKGVIKSGGGNTIFNNLYVLLDSEFPLNGGTNIKLNPATLNIKRGQGELNKTINVTLVNGNTARAYVFAQNAALMANDTITLTIPFETSSGYTSNVLKNISVQGYVDAESSLVPADPYNPAATPAYTKYGKDKLAYAFQIVNNFMNNWVGLSYTRTDNTVFTATVAGLRFAPDTYNNFQREVTYAYSPQTYELVIPDGYELGGGTYGENLNVRWLSGTYAGQSKQVAYASKTLNEAGRTVYTYDLSQLFDPTKTAASGDPAKWALPDEFFYICLDVSAKATKAAETSSQFTATAKGYYLLNPNYGSGVLYSQTGINTPLFYTGPQILLSVPTNTVTAYSKTLTVPTVTPSNPNSASYKLWLYVDGNITNLKAQELGSMNFPINGQGTDGKWIPLDNMAAKTGRDYSLTFDYLNMSNCAGDTVIVYTVFDNGNAAYNPINTPFANISTDNLGQYKRIIIKPAPAAIHSTLSVTPSNLTYNTPYTLSATVDASSSQGILKNDTLIITIPAGQEYIPNSAKVEYPTGTNVAVAASVEAALVALNANLTTDRTFKFNTAEALGNPAFAFDGIASGVAAANQRSKLTAQFKPLCDTRLTGIRYLVEPRGYSACGQLATGSGRNFRSEVMVSNISTGYEYSVAPVTVSGNRAFNEQSKTESLQVTIKKVAGTGVAEPTNDSLVITMPSALNVSGAITLVSTGLSINTTIGAAAYRNTVSGSVRTIAAQLPAATVASTAPLNQDIVFTMTTTYTPNGQAFANNPEQTIDAIVQTNVKFDAACPNAPASVGNGSLGVAFLTAQENPALACLNMPVTLEITTDGFVGKWYKEAAKTTELSALATYTYTPQVQKDTTFYVSALVSGTDYGVVPVKVQMNPELKPIFTASNVCDTRNTVFTNNTTLGGTAAPATVTYEWYEWANNAKTAFSGTAFTDKNPSQAFPVGKHKAFVLATSAAGCVASSDTIEFEVYALPVPTLTGKTPACLNSSEIYTTDAGMTAYTWTMSKSNGTDFDGDLSPSVINTATVSWETPNVVGVISVNYTDAHGCRAAAPTELNVIVRNLPATPILASGANEVCANSEEMYIIRKVTGIKSYNWSLSGLGSIVTDADEHDNTASILWGNTSGNAILTINQVNNDGCEAEIPLTVAIKVKGSGTPIINGSATACANGVVRYGTAAGMTAYQWTVTGGTYTGVSGSPNEIDVTWGAAGTGTISVSYTSDGCPAAMTTPFSVSISARPTLSWQSTPKVTVCVGEEVTYTVPAGKTNYVWTVVGASGYTGGGTSDNSVTVTWDNLTSGSVSVNYEDGGCPAASPLKVNVSISKVTMQPTTFPSPGTGILCVSSGLHLTNPTVGTQTWRSANTAVATVDAGGTVTGVAKGSAIIWCVVSNAAGCKDSISATVTVQDKTVISTQPVPTTSICPSESTTLSVVATGESPLSYIWKKGGVAIQGAISSSVSVSEAGTYTVDVQGCGSAVTSANAVVTVKKETKITVQPQNAAICPTANATLSVTATGEGTLTYQWKKDGVTIPTATTASYTASAEGDYTVEVTGDCGAAVLSSVAKVTTKLPTVINTQPVGGEICAGSTLKLEVVATGEGTLNYQWKKDGSNVGGNSAGYQANAAGSYTVEISGGCGSPAVSDAVSVSVKAVTAISTQPAATSAICPGDNVTLSVVASGASPVTYQWTKNGTNIAGAQGTSYTADAAGTYKVIVTGACGTPLESSNAVVTLKKATVINIQPAAASAICSGQSASLSVSADGEGTLTYLWKKNGVTASGTNNQATYSATEAGNYTVEVTGGCGLPVLSNTAIVTVKAATVINNHPQSADICRGSSQILSVTATGEGTLNYQWKLNGSTNVGGNSSTYSANAAGSYTVDVTGECGSAVPSQAAVITVKTPVSITTNPTAANAICPGETVDLTVVAAGEGSLSYQWQKGGSNIAGAQSDSYTADAAGTYKVIVTDACGTQATGTNAVVTLKKATKINIQPAANSAICSTESVQLSVSADGEGTLTYLWKKNGVAASGINNAATYTATEAGTYTVEVTGACGLPVLSNPSVVTMKTATSINSQPIGGAICSGSSLTLSVTATGEGTLTYTWKKDGSPIGGNSATLNATAAGSYTVDVKGECGNAVISTAAVITIKPSATITTQPVGGAICAGENLDLSVAATGEANLTYQWKRGGMSISGANASAYTATEAGSYTVAVTDGCNLTVTSNPATVTQKASTKITAQPAGGSICTGDNLVLSVSATGEGTLTYQWKRNGTTLASATNATYTATAAGNYTVEVQGSCGEAVVSNVAAITQKAATQITEQPQGATICQGGSHKLTVSAIGEGVLSYQWNKGGSAITGAVSASYTATEAGNYTVTVNGECGNITSAAVAVVIEIPTFTLSQSTDAICFGESYNLNDAINQSSISGGNRFTYVVDGVETSNPNVQPQTSGDHVYGIILHSTQCAGDPLTFTLTVRALPQIHVEGNNLCIGGTASFVAEIYSGESGTGAWHSDNNSVATIDATGGLATGISAGSFKATYHFTSADGCASIIESTDSYQVFPLPKVTVKDAVVCAGARISFDDLVKNVSNGGDYKVYAGGTNTEITDASIIISATTTYDIEGVNQGTGCVSATRVPVTVTAIATPIFALPATTDVCTGGSVDLAPLVTGVNLTTGYTVEVYKADGVTPITGTTVSPTASSEIFNLRIVSTDAGCVSAFKTIRVNVGSRQYVSLTEASDDYELCVGESLTLTPTPAGSGTSIAWSSSNTDVADVDNAGVVTALVGGQAEIRYTYRDAQGCEGIGTREIKVNALPKLLNVANRAACEGETVLLSGLASTNSDSRVNYYLGSATTAETTDRVIVGTSNIVYTIEAENLESGCVSAGQTVTIVATAKPAFTVTGADICQGESIDLSSLVSGISVSDYNLVIEDAAGKVLNTGTVTPTAQTTVYRVRVVNNTVGCVSEQQNITITLKDKPVLTVKDLTACAGASINLNDAVTGGATTLTFYRDAAGSDKVNAPDNLIVATGASTFYVQGEENGCKSDIRPIQVTGEAIPVFEITGGEFSVCEKTKGVAYTAPDNFYNYTWTVSGGTIASQTGNTVYVDWDVAGYGKIAIQYATSVGCTGSSAKEYQVVIKPSPDPVFTVETPIGDATAIVCTGSELLLSPLTGNGSWTVTPSSLASISGNKLTALAGITSVKTIEVRYSLTNANGCGADSVKTVTVNPLPVASDVRFSLNLPDNSVISSGGSASVCSGTGVVVHSDYIRDLFWELTWTDSELESHMNQDKALSAVLIDKSKRFDITQVKNNVTGCVSTNAADLATLGITILVKDSVKIITPPVGGGICLPDGTLTLTTVVSSDASDNLTYVWTNAAGETIGNESSYTATTGGTYQVKVEGCNADSARATVSEALPIIAQKRNHTLWVNNNSDANGGYSFAYYVWTQDGVELQRGSHNDNYGVYYTGGSDLTLNSIYQVQLTTVDGKTFQSCPYSYVPQSFGASVRAYPNPVVKSAVKTVYVDVEIDDASVLADAVISVYASDGRFIGTVRCEGRRITPIAMPSITGVYVLKFVSAAIEKEIKIIVE